MSLSRKLVEPALREYLRCWADDDREGWLSLFAAEATLEDPVGAPVIRGLRRSLRSGTVFIKAIWTCAASSTALSFAVMKP